MATGDGASKGKINESLSQFLARILDQLSITAWLPALALVGIILILAQLSRHEGSSVEAFSAIGDMGFAAIGLLVAGVVITTMFTQAFEFEAIRVLEGYWRPTGLVGAFAGWRSGRHRTKRKKLVDAHSGALADAFRQVRQNLRAAGYSSSVIDALDSYVTSVPMVSETTAADKTAAKTLVSMWKARADPGVVQRVDGLAHRVDEYPALQHRVLPTRLGNIIRAVEDRVYDPAEGRLENFAIHVLDQLPRSIARAFREQRRRLDLYCGLVFVFGAAVVPSVILGQLYGKEHRATAIVVPSTIAILTLASYRAALASGRKFGLALAAIKEHRDRQAATPSDPHQAADLQGPPP